MKPWFEQTQATASNSIRQKSAWCDQACTMSGDGFSLRLTAVISTPSIVWSKLPNFCSRCPAHRLASDPPRHRIQNLAHHLLVRISGSYRHMKAMIRALNAE